jgi:hypothetical protein
MNRRRIVSLAVGSLLLVTAFAFWQSGRKQDAPQSALSHAEVLPAGDPFPPMAPDNHERAERVPVGTLHDDRFSSAPTSWRTAGAAVAEVTNRWECDPRWSFFTLRNDPNKGRAAVLWSKYLYPGDVTVEFYVAPKMDRSRGNQYAYARDINVTICSDGSDLTKGYTFMFGGRDNQGSYILRDGVEVARHPARIARDTNLHHHWYVYRVEKIGCRITFSVDRYFAGEKRNELLFEDSDPLIGDRVAIWTYDDTISIARVRISGTGGLEMEDPSFIPGPLKTPLDEPGTKN